LIFRTHLFPPRAFFSFFLIEKFCFVLSLFFLTLWPAFPNPICALSFSWILFTRGRNPHFLPLPPSRDCSLLRSILPAGPYLSSICPLLQCASPIPVFCCTFSFFLSPRVALQLPRVFCRTLHALLPSFSRVPLIPLFCALLILSTPTAPKELPLPLSIFPKCRFFFFPWRISPPRSVRVAYSPLTFPRVEKNCPGVPVLFDAVWTPPELPALGADRP